MSTKALVRSTRAPNINRFPSRLSRSMPCLQEEYQRLEIAHAELQEQCQCLEIKTAILEEMAASATKANLVKDQKLRKMEAAGVGVETIPDSSVQTLHIDKADCFNTVDRHALEMISSTDTLIDKPLAADAADVANLIKSGTAIPEPASDLSLIPPTTVQRDNRQLQLDNGRQEKEVREKSREIQRLQQEVHQLQTRLNKHDARRKSDNAVNRHLKASLKALAEEFKLVQAQLDEERRERSRLQVQQLKQQLGMPAVRSI